MGHHDGHGHHDEHATGGSGTGTVILTVVAVAVMTYAMGWASRPGLPLPEDIRENAGPGYFEPLPARGPADAAVVVVDVIDFKCGHCAKHHGFLKRLMAEHRDLRFAVKFLPFMKKDESERAAIAAMAANRQNRFWDYADMLYKHQSDAWDAETLIKYAEALGLNPQRFRADMRDPALRSYVRRDKAAAEALDVGGTPTLYVNGRTVPVDAIGPVGDPSMFRTMVRDAQRAVAARVATGSDVVTARAADAEKHSSQGGAFARLYMLNDAQDLTVDLRSE